ncbi:MAG: hypothetical protein AAGK93_06425 [Pseudomonadota bacterium]
MIRTHLAALAGLTLAACAPTAQNEQAELSSWQDVLASEGLTAAEAKLNDRPESPETSFALGAVQFLRASEAIMQVRYQNSTTPLEILPGMRNRLPTNPNAEFDPAFIEIAMTQALEHLDRAETSLEKAAGETFGLEVSMANIWFDVNANGRREDWESALAVMADLNAEPSADFDGIVRFDSADAHWLKAYVHVMSGMAELTLAVDPTSAIKTVHDGRVQMDTFGDVEGMFLDNETIDTLATVLLTLRGVPEADRTRAAHQHFRDMIAENRAFWTAVAAETDNDREWLPNPSQTSAFGVEVNEEMAQGRQDVLVEIEHLLEGETLIPYWRYNNGYNAETGIGVNLAKFLQDPGDMDVILWIHGAGAAPYLETGNLARLRAWDRFAGMTRGDGLMFAAWFN